MLGHVAVDGGPARADCKVGTRPFLRLFRLWLGLGGADMPQTVTSCPGSMGLWGTRRKGDAKGGCQSGCGGWKSKLGQGLAVTTAVAGLFGGGLKQLGRNELCRKGSPPPPCPFNSMPAPTPPSKAVLMRADAFSRAGQKLLGVPADRVVRVVDGCGGLFGS